MATWMVTGGSGFLGRHLLATLESGARPGTRIVVLDRRPPDGFPLDDFALARLEEPVGLQRQIERFEPDVVFHLAGLTPPASPERMFDVNARGTASLLEALRRVGRPVRVVVAGSAAELGPVPLESLPVNEAFPCRPESAYGSSKWFATTSALRCPPPLEVVVARVFNPIGPGSPPSQVFGRFAQELASSEVDPVRLVVHDLDARRDFIDARDVARAFIGLAVRGRPGLVYHVGRGESRSIRDGLDFLIEISRRRVELVHTPSARRGPADSIADISRIQAHTGWSPEIYWEHSLADLYHESVNQARTREVA